MRALERSSGGPAELEVVAKYARLAPEYDARWSFYVEATTRETLARLSLRPTDRVLDVGCGTGALLERLTGSHPVGLLSGVDPVPEMLAVARGRMPAEVELREGWVERLPFAEEQFDVVASCNMFHYIRRPVDALHEIKRVLRPGGRLVVTDWCDDYLACRVCSWYLRRTGDNITVYRRRECLRLLQEAGYRDVEVERYRISWLWGLMTATGSR
jgi:ubiquinone/menaquinone biosynthesis C-methylase UbiE